MCCKDHLHCCPEGTTCNSAAGKCDRGESSVSMTWFTKTAATPVREEKTSSVLCPDGKGTCPEGSTCCLLASGQYGCCPLPKVIYFFVPLSYTAKDSKKVNSLRNAVCNYCLEVFFFSFFCSHFSHYNKHVPTNRICLILVKKQNLPNSSYSQKMALKLQCS